MLLNNVIVEDKGMREFLFHQCATRQRLGNSWIVSCRDLHNMVRHREAPNCDGYPCTPKQELQNLAEVTQAVSHSGLLVWGSCGLSFCLFLWQCWFAGAFLFFFRFFVFRFLFGLLGLFGLFGLFGVFAGSGLVFKMCRSRGLVWVLRRHFFECFRTSELTKRWVGLGREYLLLIPVRPLKDHQFAVKLFCYYCQTANLGIDFDTLETQNVALSENW